MLAPDTREKEGPDCTERGPSQKMNRDIERSYEGHVGVEVVNMIVERYVRGMGSRGMYKDNFMKDIRWRKLSK